MLSLNIHEIVSITMTEPVLFTISGGQLFASRTLTIVHRNTDDQEQTISLGLYAADPAALAIHDHPLPASPDAAG